MTAEETYKKLVVKQREAKLAMIQANERSQIAQQYASTLSREYYEIGVEVRTAHEAFVKEILGESYE